MTPLTPVSAPTVPSTSHVSASQTGESVLPTTEPQVLRCENTADFLAALPTLTGFTAENSLFVVCFQGDRGGNVMRINLPDSDDPSTTKDFLDFIVSLLRQTGAGKEGPAAVITTSLSFAAAPPIPRGRLARQLKRCFQREGWRLRELAVVASDGWCGLLHDSTGIARPLSEIEQSPVSMRVKDRAQPIMNLASVGELPEADPGRTESVEFHLKQLHQRRLAGSTHPASSMPREDRALLNIRQAARIADVCFAAPPRGGTGPAVTVPARRAAPARPSEGTMAAEPHKGHQTPERLLAKLIDAVQTQTGWLVCVLTALTRAEFVVDMAHETGADRFTDIHVERLPGTRLGAREGWNIRHLLTSLAHEMPPREKLRRVIAVTEDAIAHAPGEFQPPLFAMLAWAWWAIGMQSVATRIVARGLSTAPTHELLLMVQQLCEAPPSAHLLGLREEIARAA